jgi:acyl carrier protein
MLWWQARHQTGKTLPMDQNQNPDDTMTRLATLFREVFNDPALTIAPSTTADDIEGWDSMTHISLLVAAEQDFDIHFKASEMDGLQDVGELARLIDAKRAMAAATP